MPRDIKILDRQCYASGITIIERGSEGNRAYIIESGKVEVFMRDSEGEIVSISTLGPGALIGEIALMEGGHRIASIKTIEPTVLVSISAYDFRDAILKSSNLRKSLASKVSRRLQETITVIEDVKQPEKIKADIAQKEVFAIMDHLKTTLDRIVRKTGKNSRHSK